MENSTRLALEALGMNIERTLTRLANNESLLFRLLTRFTQETSYERLVEAIEKGDAKEAFEAAHTLKGLAGNLGLDALYTEISPLTELLRSGDLDQAVPLFPAVQEKYIQAIETISQMDGGV